MTPAAPPRRILVVNTVALNAGDAAILLGLIAALRQAFGQGLEVEVADDQPGTARELYPSIRFVPGLYAHRPGERPLTRSARRRRVGLAVRLSRWSHRLARLLLDETERAHVDRLARADAVVSTGGTYFMEHYTLWRRAAELLVAQNVGTPTFLYTQSLGPFEERVNRRVMRRVVSGSRRAFLRDRRSLEHLADLGVDPAMLSVHPDAAFALARAGPDGACGAERPAGEGGPRSPGSPGSRPLRVAVSVRHWRHFGDRGRDAGLDLYKRSVAAAVRWLHDAGAEVVFVSTCQGVEAYWTDDSRFARRLVDEHLSDLPRVRVDTAFREPESLIEELASYDLALATRMHFAILALCAGVPVVPIAYEFKTRELFAELGMEGLVTDIHVITPDALVARVESAAGSLHDLRDRILGTVAGLAPAAAEPAAIIRDALDHDGSIHS